MRPTKEAAIEHSHHTLPFRLEKEEEYMIASEQSRDVTRSDQSGLALGLGRVLGFKMDMCALDSRDRIPGVQSMLVTLVTLFIPHADC